MAGPPQHDPRFGDIRVGAQALASDALSISVPNDPAFTGTLTGDAVLNSAEFSGKTLDPFAVMLHEAGHVLGLEHSTDPHSPMFSHLNANTALTATDVHDLQALYGIRQPDSHEGSSGNGTPEDAAQVPIPGSYTGSTPLIAFGDIGSNADVDFYEVKPPGKYQGGITFRLQTAGVSLLTPHLSVFDSHGHLLGEAQAAGITGETVTVPLAKANPDETYLVKVEGATKDAFGIGHYGLSVTFDGLSTSTETALDSTLRGDYQGLGPNEVDAILRDPLHVLLRDDHHSDDNSLSAVTIAPSPGFAKETHYTTLGSISDPADADTYRIKVANAPSGASNVLTVRVRSLGTNGGTPRVAIFDSEMTPVAARVLANGEGLFTIQVANVKSGGNLVLRVSGDGDPSRVGNYGLDADYGSVAAAPSTFVDGGLSADSPSRSSILTVARTQLFQFLLSTDAARLPTPVPGGVRMTITDAAGRIVFELSSPGEVASGPAVLLLPGVYNVRFTALVPAEVPVSPFTFLLGGAAISEPIGPVIQDPTTTPDYSFSSSSAVLPPAVPPSTQLSSTPSVTAPTSPAVPGPPSSAQSSPPISGSPPVSMSPPPALPNAVSSAQSDSTLTSQPVASLSPPQQPVPVSSAQSDSTLTSHPVATPSPPSVTPTGSSSLPVYLGTPTTSPARGQAAARGASKKHPLPRAKRAVHRPWVPTRKAAHRPRSAP